MLEAFEELGLLHESEQDLRKALALYRSGLGAANGINNYALNDAKMEQNAKKEHEEESEKVKEGELMPKSNA